MSSNARQMEELVNELLQNGKNRVPYSLFIGETEITTSLQDTVKELVCSCCGWMLVAGDELLTIVALWLWWW